MAEDDVVLVTLARAISDGEPVDWQRLESATVPAEHLRILRNLRVISALGGVHRTDSDDDTAPATPIGVGASLQPPRSQALVQWGQFALLERLGGGSQGDVYRALDTRLDREVALKFLKRPAAAHVLTEARLLARVRHPNVVTVYGADLLDGRVGLWMELITGETLDAMISRQGPMNAAEAAVVAVDLCRALGAVHAAGLLHRDVKAQNVMRESGGRYVLMDFGAGLDTADASAGSSRAGTPLYLAPEILAGQSASVESDVYSLGVLLFYLMSGTFPASAWSVDALAEAHARGDRRLLGEVRGDLPSAFVAIVDRAIDPDSRARFHSVAEMASALSHAIVASVSALTMPSPSPRAARFWAQPLVVLTAAVATAGALSAPAWLWLRPQPQFVGTRTIAVLPFEDLSPEQRGRYLADGLADLLITNLGQRPDVSVLARTSSRQFVGNRRTLELAREFGVNFVVEGSLQPIDHGWQVSVRLVSSTSGRLVDGRTFTTDPSRLSETHHQMADAIAASLQLPLAAVRAAAPTDAQAMEAYMRGWSEYWRLTREGFLEAERLFALTTEREPAFAPGHAARAYVTFQLEKAYKAYPTGTAAPAALQRAEAAVRIDPEDPQALAALGWIRFYGFWDWKTGEDLLRRAIDRNPSDAQARWMYAQLLMAQNRLDTALQEARLVQRLDPLTPARYSNIATVLYYSREYEQAVAQLQQLLARDPNAAVAHFGLARFLAALERYDEAVLMIRTSGNAGEPPVRAELARILTVAGRDAEAAAMLPALEADYRAGRLAPDYYAFLQLALGRAERALELLQEAVVERSPSVIWIQVDPRFDGLRNRPEFTGILRQIGLATG